MDIVGSAAPQWMVDKDAAGYTQAMQPYVTDPSNTVVWAGIVALLCGVIYFFGIRSRSGAAIVASLAGVLSFVLAFYDLVNVRGMFGDPPQFGPESHYAPGVGVVLAGVVSLAVVGLGVTAFVLERRALANASDSV